MLRKKITRLKASDITQDLCNQWNKNKLINPITGRKIKKNGYTYNLYMKRLKLFNSILNVMKNKQKNKQKNNPKKNKQKNKQINLININHNNNYIEGLTEESIISHSSTKKITTINTVSSDVASSIRSNNNFFKDILSKYTKHTSLNESSYNKLIRQFNKYSKVKTKKVSNIRIRKTNKAIELSKNPKSKDKNGKLVPHTMKFIPVETIDKNKFIMLANKMAYDIELLIMYICEKHKSGQYYNIDPETNRNKIFNNDIDIKKFMNHTLFKKPNLLEEDKYFYGKQNYIDNIKTFKIIISNFKDECYFKLFDKYPMLLLDINRLGTIFHTEQPYSFFDFDKLKFEEIQNVDDFKLDLLVKDCLNLLKSKYSNKFYGKNDIQTTELTDIVTDIFTLTYRDFFQSKIIEYGIILPEIDRLKLMVNISYLWGVFLNFRESNTNKKIFIEYIHTLPSEDRILIEELLNPIFNSNECIHYLGNHMKILFVKWWFKYLEYYGYEPYEISHKFIPITYDSINTVNNGVQSKSKKNIYKNSIIQSNILKQGNEKRQGYGLVLSSTKYKNPSWYYQMGKTKNWDGIDLILKKFNHRKHSKPF